MMMLAAPTDRRNNTAHTAGLLNIGFSPRIAYVDNYPRPIRNRDGRVLTSSRIMQPKDTFATLLWTILGLVEAAAEQNSHRVFKWREFERTEKRGVEKCGREKCGGELNGSARWSPCPAIRSLTSRPFRPPTNAKRPPAAHFTTRACR